MSIERIEYEFDNAAFMADVRSAIGNNPSLRDIQAVVDISISSLSRIDNGHMMDMETLLIVAAKLELNPCAYFKRVVWERKS